MATITNTLPWIDSPFFNTELAASDLNESDRCFVKNYSDNGYVIIDSGIAEQTLNAVIEGLAEKLNHLSVNSDTTLRDAWKYNEDVKKIATSENILNKLRLLYRREPIPFQTLNTLVSTQINTHSDMIHLNSIPERFMCGVWLALEDCAFDNGPFHYYPQSHKLPFYDMIDVGVKASETIKMKKEFMAFAENYENFIGEMVKALDLKKSILTIKKGQALIWAANMLHGAEKIIRPGATRLSQVSHYYFENCMYYVPRLSDIAINKIYLNDLTNIKTGKKVPNTYMGEKVKPATKLYLEQQTIKSFKKIAHLFPESLISKMKSLIG